MTEDNTPPVHLVTDEERREHFERYPPGTPPIRLEPTMHDERFERLERHVASLLSSRKNTLRALWIAIPALLGALGTVLVFAAEKIATSSERAGKVEATLESEKERRQSLEREVEQLRAVLLRLGFGIGDPRKPTSDVPKLPDLLSWRHFPSGTPASTIGLSGRVFLHTPKLQYGQGFKMPLLHSMLLLHTDPQVDSGSTWPGMGVGCSWAALNGIIPVRHPKASPQITPMINPRAILHIPQM